MAHPDDVDFGWAGSIAVMTDAGIHVAYCLVTDGDAGGSETGIARDEMAPLRRDEQRAAAAIVGVHELHFLGYPDGRVESSLDLRRDITRVIRRVRPDRVMTQSPDRNWDRIYASHPDHLAAGEATVAAVYPDARNRWAHPELSAEGLEPWTVDALWMGIGREAATHYVDITSAVERKIEALLSHKSQLPDPDATATMVRSWTGATAQAAGLPEGRAAEALRVVGTI
ncbi:MAG TPA: PIG-L deacetylase family protein [Acidimicrobiia bacterium]|nr:PIG-L deacetylase family protein [Acidimicrobiia bacterium]